MPDTKLISIESQFKKVVDVVFIVVVVFAVLVVLVVLVLVYFDLVVIDLVDSKNLLLKSNQNWVIDK